jgi:hypothetical protein
MDEEEYINTIRFSVQEPCTLFPLHFDFDSSNKKFVFPICKKIMPLQSDERLRNKIYQQNLKLIKNLMDLILNKNFDNYLLLMDMSEVDYLNAIKSTLKSPKVFIKRKKNEININFYNADILDLHNANIDILLRTFIRVFCERS